MNKASLVFIVLGSMLSLSALAPSEGKFYFSDRHNSKAVLGDMSC